MDNFLLFAFTSLMLNISPGPDMLYVASRSAGQGLKAGIASTLGISAGCFVHIAAAMLGISAILAQSATAFNIVKWAGALYLIYIGIQSFRSKGEQINVKETVAEIPLFTLFRQGFITAAGLSDKTTIKAPNRLSLPNIRRQCFPAKNTCSTSTPTYITSTAHTCLPC